MSIRSKIESLATAAQARALNASPVFMRALAESLRQVAGEVGQLEAAVLPPAATAPRDQGNVVSLDCAALRRLRDQVITPPDGGNAA